MWMNSTYVQGRFGFRSKAQQEVNLRVILNLENTDFMLG